MVFTLGQNSCTVHTLFFEETSLVLGLISTGDDCVKDRHAGTQNKQGVVMVVVMVVCVLGGGGGGDYTQPIHRKS